MQNSEAMSFQAKANKFGTTKEMIQSTKDIHILILSDLYGLKHPKRIRKLKKDLKSEQ